MENKKLLKILHSWWLNDITLLDEWILADGFWADNKVWKDEENWID